MRALNDIYWNIEDPSSFKGSEEEILIKTRQIRDLIQTKVEDFIDKNIEYAKIKNSLKKHNLVRLCFIRLNA